MTKIFIDVPPHPPAVEALTSRDGLMLDCYEQPEERARAMPAERIRDAEILFCLYPPTNFDAMRRLRWVQIASAGYQQLYGLGLVERGIRASNALGVFDIPIAEWNVAMMVNLARDVRQMIRNQESAVWDRAAAFQREIRGMTVGFWGYGGIGRETARLAKALGMRVHVLTRSGVRPRRNVYQVPETGDPEGVLPDRVFQGGEESGFLEELDFLIVSVPLTPATRGAIGERELRALPRRAYVLNPARGPIIEQQALLRALDEGWIAGAALDTHYAYPLSAGHPLWRYRNVILTPHISGSSESQHVPGRLWDIFTQNVGRYLGGAALLNELTPKQLAGG